MNRSDSLTRNMLGAINLENLHVEVDSDIEIPHVKPSKPGDSTARAMPNDPLINDHKLVEPPEPNKIIWEDLQKKIS